MLIKRRFLNLELILPERAIYKVGPLGDTLDRVVDNDDYNMTKEFNQLFDSGKIHTVNIIVFPYWGGGRGIAVAYSSS